MNCERFEEHIHEIATGRTGDGALERESRRHAEACAECADRLEGEVRVSRLLEALAAADADVEAPVAVEATVLGAFRLAHGTANVVAMPVAATGRRPGRVRLLAAAAAIFVAAAAGLVTWRAMSSVPGGLPAPASPPRTAVAPPTGGSAGSPPVAPGGTSYQADPTRGNQKGPAVPVANIGRTTGRRDTVRPVRSEEPTELVTDFYALVPKSDSAQLEGGQLVRLEVPSASLASLGVPIPVSNPYGSVTADIVMGYDGVAHAIRFVQPNTTDERRRR